MIKDEVGHLSTVAGSEMLREAELHGEGDALGL